MRENTRQGSPRCSCCRKGITGNAAWFEFTYQGEEMRMCEKCFQKPEWEHLLESSQGVKLLWPGYDPESVRMMQRYDPKYKPPKPPRIVREFLEAEKGKATR